MIFQACDLITHPGVGSTPQSPPCFSAQLFVNDAGHRFEQIRIIANVVNVLNAS